jgi:hypothetical protein
MPSPAVRRAGRRRTRLRPLGSSRMFIRHRLEEGEEPIYKDSLDRLKEIEETGEKYRNNFGKRFNLKNNLKDITFLKKL